MKRLLLLLGAAALLVAAPAFAQYVYLDTNGDGVCNSSDALSDVSNSIDIWFDTDTNKDGTPAVCSDGMTEMSIFSYEFILSSNGSVTYGAYTNLMPTMTIPFGMTSGGNDYHNGFGGTTNLAPGTYKVGTIAVTVAPGTNPIVSLAATTSLDANFFTAFGSFCPSPRFDSTIILGLDFMDPCGTAATTPVRSTTWGAIKNLYK